LPKYGSLLRPANGLIWQLEYTSNAYHLRHFNLAGVIFQIGDSADEETFGLLLFAFKMNTGVKILNMTAGTSFEQTILNVGIKEIEQWCGLDRISIALKSGTSVSVALKRSPIAKGDMGHRIAYAVNILVDPNGRLPWPDPDRKRNA
jgi:hypothetical protein